MKFALLFSILGLGSLFAQTNAQIRYVTVAPAGACQSRANVSYLTPTGILYTCQNNVWGIVGSGGGGGMTGPGSAVNLSVPAFNGITGNILLDPARLIFSGATNGTLTFYNPTAVTGTTSLELTCGAANAGTGTAPLLTAHFSTVALHTANHPSIGSNCDGSFGIYDAAGDTFRKQFFAQQYHALASTGVIKWENNTNVDAGAADAGFARSTTNVLCTNQGGADCSALGDQILRNVTVNGTQNYCASATGSDTYTCNLAGPALTGYTAGDCIIFYPSATANTGAATVNVNGLGAKSIKTSVGNDPADGALAIGSTYQLCYDGTNFLMPQDNSTSGQGLNVISISGSNAINGKFFFQKITITGNATISAINNIKQGLYIWIICQDGTGGWTFTWPASVLGGMTIGSTLSKCNTQEFASDGTSLYATTPGVINE